MSLSINLLILILTVGISITCFSNQELFSKLLYSPFNVRRNNEWYRILTHALVHGDYAHLFVNMYVLYMFGDILESEFMYRFDVVGGRIGYVALYVGGVLFASLPGLRKHSDNPGYSSVGASGAVAAVIFGFILVHPTETIYLFFAIPMPAFVLAILYLVYESYMDKRGGTRIAHDAHIWGAIFGLGFLILIRYEYLFEFIDKISYYIGSVLG